MSRLLYERLARSPQVTPQKVAKLLQAGLSLQQIDKKIGRPGANRLGDPFLTPACGEFPQKLLELYDPPLQLFHRGLPPKEIPPLVVGVVGSRKASSFGLSWAHRLGVALARRKVGVCSGLALGIDGAVHRGVLEERRRNPSSGPPIAVLGHGWGYMHPSKHRELGRQVETEGLLLTEYPRDSPPSRWSFPARNRIIAGLSDHLVVVEAGAKSGSLYTAEFALDLGRPVWIVPNAPGKPNSAGVLGLWQSGASVMIDIEEFAETVAPQRWVSKEQTEEKMAPLSPESRHLLNLLAADDGNIEQVCHKVDWSPVELAYRLTELELEGLIRRTYEGNWELLRWDLLGNLK